MRALLSLLLAGWALSACEAPPTVYLLPERVAVSAPRDGVVSVSGGPGAVVGEVTTLTLTIVREAVPAPAFRLQHLGGQLPIASTFAAVKPDGSFDPVSLGEAERPVQAGDELNLTPQNGVRQVGYTVGNLHVP